MKSMLFDWLVRLFWIVGGYIIWTTDKLELHRSLNSFHTPFLDTISQVFTFLGDGLFVILLILIFAFYSLSKSLILFVIFLASSGIVQFLKHGVYESAMRPMYFFKDDATFHQIPDFTYFYYNSFPSGHSTAIFALGTFLSFFLVKGWQQIGLFVVIITVAFTRVYLSQHFFEDVIIGSFIGFFVSKYATEWLEPYSGKWNKSILKVIRKG
jgi:membrane-associated phospholipid phosphatase